MKAEFKLVRTDATQADFRALVVLLDAELAITDGEDHDFYHQFNGLDHIKHVIVAYQNETPVGCGAIKQYDQDCMEIKRLYVPKPYRRSGFAMQILIALQSWAKELNFKKCILETGNNQPEAITLYHKAKFKVMENYGQYADVQNSICFEKVLS